MPCTIRYAILPSKQIFNFLGPERVPVGWTPGKIAKRKQNMEDLLERRKEFYDMLEASILEEGFRNPILVTAGLWSDEYHKIDPKPVNTRTLIDRIHPDMRQNLDKRFTCERWGGSRLYIAQRLGVDIPCIVSDFNNMLSGHEILKTKEDVLLKFKDKPDILNIDECGVAMSGLAPTPKVEGGSYKIKYAIIPSDMIKNNICPTSERIEIMEKEQQFFSKLEKSILENGFRNPIVINARKNNITNRYGGSRLMFAQKYNLNIPCIIADFDNIFPEAKEISVNEIRNYFKDQPHKIYTKPNGLNISGCKHIHLRD